MPSVEGQRRAGLVALALLGVAALSEGWLRSRRPLALGLRAGAELVVTSSNDNGPGSLREAIFVADSADVRTRITMRTKRVVLKTPLPPLANPRGIVLDATEARTEIDASALAEGPVLELRGPDSSIQGLGIRGAAGAAVLVRAPRIRLHSLSFTNCAEAVTLVDGAADVVLEDSQFEANATGVTVPEARAVTLQRNRFARHDHAAIWAVSPRSAAVGGPAGLIVRDSQFADDRISVVLINVAGLLERNDFRRARESAVYLMGTGAVVRDNRSREGASVGIFADESEGALIEGNEVDHNAGVGLMLRSSGGAVVQRNRVYSNGYGVVVVFGQKALPNRISDNLLFGHAQDGIYIVGGSPLVRSNRAVQNREAAIRILDFAPWSGPQVPAEPLVEDNVFSGNSFDTAVRGVYRQPPPKRESELQ